MKKKVIEAISIFIVIFIFSMIFRELTSDDIWNYGFAYNISKGLVPYRDFNMITTPLYPLVDAFFLIIFGRNIIIHFIINTIICCLIYFDMKKAYPQCYYLPFAILLLFSSPNYNLICLFFFYILQRLEKENKSDYLIGIVLGLTFLTKQSIGIYFCIPTLFTKDIKKIIKRIIGFIIPNLFILFYLLYNHALYNFIDYCFLGIKEFSNQNLFTVPSALIFILVGLGYLIWQYLKDKDYKIIYYICFFGMAYPITDPYHVIIPFIPALGHMLNQLNLNKKVIGISFITFVISIAFYNIYITRNDYQIPNKTSNFKYCKIDNYTTRQINTITNYVKNSDKNTFIIDGAYGYIVKLELNRDIGKYDFFLTGNVGKNGSYHLINEFDNLCKNERCTFIINDYNYTNNIQIGQYNKTIHKYVIDNYHEDGKIIYLSIYNNH